MELPPPAPSVGEVPEDDETAPYDHSGDPFLDGDETVDYEGDGALTTTSSRFWGVTWHRAQKKWQAHYTDADGKTRYIGQFDDDEEAARAVNKAISDAGLEGKRHTNAVDATGALVPRERTYGDRSAVVAPDPARDLTATTSKFWGVSWHKRRGRWEAYYTDATGERRSIGHFDTEEEAARAYNAAIRRAGLEHKRSTNPVDATGVLVPKPKPSDRSAVVAPDPALAPTATTSKFWGVTWDKKRRRWAAQYTDANGKRRGIGRFDTQEAAAHAVNAAIRRAGLEGKRHTNAVVDGRLVPRETHKRRGGKRRREEPAAAPSPRARRR